MEGCRLTLVLSALSSGIPRHGEAARKHLRGLGQGREAQEAGTSGLELHVGRTKQCELVSLLLTSVPPLVWSIFLAPPGSSAAPRRGRCLLSDENLQAMCGGGRAGCRFTEWGQKKVPEQNPGMPGRSGMG